MAKVFDTDHLQVYTRANWSDAWLHQSDLQIHQAGIENQSGQLELVPQSASRLLVQSIEQGRQVIFRRSKGVMILTPSIFCHIGCELASNLALGE